MAHDSAQPALPSRRAQSAQIYFSVDAGRVAGTLVLEGEPPRKFADVAQLERLLQIGSGRLVLVCGSEDDGQELLPLSDKERAIVEAAAAGSSNREIADALFYSVKSVEAYLTRVYRRYRLSGRGELGRLLDSVGDLGPAGGEAELITGGTVTPGGTGAATAPAIALRLVVV